MSRGTAPDAFCEHLGRLEGDRISQRLRMAWGPQTLTLILKLLFAPAVTWGICILMGLPRDVSDEIVVATATPVGVLITISAAEYKTVFEFISTAVVLSTLLSPIFVTAWILAVRLL